MDQVDVVIVGAGPAGLMCAQHCAGLGLRTLVLEKNTKPGRKLLVTGSGKCNLSNARPIEEFMDAYGTRSNFVRPALLNFGPNSLISFFDTWKLAITELHDGKLFPASMRASDVLTVLLDACSKAGAFIRTNAPVCGIQRMPGAISGFDIAIECDKGQGGRTDDESQTIQSRFVVIACGGMSWQVTGSTGDGYSLASSFGHSVVAPRAALTPAYPSDYDCASCAGVACEDIPVRLWRKDKKIVERIGDVLFTHKGLSGPGILDMSRTIREGDQISLALAHDWDKDRISQRIVDLCAASPRKTVKNILCALNIPEALVIVLLMRCMKRYVTGKESLESDKAADLTGAVLSRSLRLAIAAELTDFRFTVSRIGGFEEAMATAGGVATAEVKARTMESRLMPGLYFAGEVLDVDGDTGGYNLQFAFSSGVLAADSIKRALGCLH